MALNKQVCTVCKIQYPTELERIRKYLKVCGNIVCDECYNEIFRLSKAKRKSLYAIYDKYICVVRKIRFNETRTRDFAAEIKEIKNFYGKSAS